MKIINEINKTRLVGGDNRRLKQLMNQLWTFRNYSPNLSIQD